MTNNANVGNHQGKSKYKVAEDTGGHLVAVDKCVIGYRGEAKKGGVGIARLRLSSIEKLIFGRHEGPYTLDDGEKYFDVALPLLVEIASARGKPANSHLWAAKWTPGLIGDHDAVWFMRREAEAYGVKLKLKSDKLAKLLKVTDEEVRLYDLQTFGSIDRPKRQRTKERKEKDRQYQKNRRQERDGATPREQSISATEPWIAAGYNTRRTWERNGKKPRVANPSAPVLGTYGQQTNLRHETAEPAKPVVVEISTVPASDDLSGLKRLDVSAFQLRQLRKEFTCLAKDLTAILLELDPEAPEIIKHRHKWLRARLRERNREANAILMAA